MLFTCVILKTTFHHCFFRVLSILQQIQNCNLYISIPQHLFEHLRHIGDNKIVGYGSCSTKRYKAIRFFVQFLFWQYTSTNNKLIFGRVPRGAKPAIGRGAGAAAVLNLPVVSFVCVGITVRLPRVGKITHFFAFFRTFFCLKRQNMGKISPKIQG